MYFIFNSFGFLDQRFIKRENNRNTYHCYLRYVNSLEVQIQLCILTHICIWAGYRYFNFLTIVDFE